MRILLFYQYFGTPNGSWSTRIYELTRRWVKDGHSVYVVTSPYEKSDIKAKGLISYQKIEGINLIVIDSGDSNRLNKFNRVLRSVFFALVSVYYALIAKYDVAIASSGPITIGLPLLGAKILRRKKVIFEVRDLWPAGGIEMGLIKIGWQSRIALWFERKIYKNSDHIITASIGQQEHIHARFPNVPISVVANASDNELFGAINKQKLPKWTENKIMFTHIGSLGYIHNISFWLKVANALKNDPKARDIILIFIGDGNDKDNLVDESNQMGLKNIKFLGLKPKKNLPVWIQNSVATLFATLDNVVQNTCSPNKIFDSFAAGVPIVQTSTGWIGELVEESKCGINVPLSNPKLAADKMIELAFDEKKRNELGINAKKLAENEFSRDYLADKYLAVIQDLIKKNIEDFT